MAPPHNHLHLSTLHRRCSKAQTSFFNILHIISVFPADVTRNNFLTQKEFVIDLNVDTIMLDNNNNDRVRIKSETQEQEQEQEQEHSEISHVGDQSSCVVEYNGSTKEVIIGQDEGYLGLLIEAAQMILGDYGSEPDEKKLKPRCEAEPRRSKRKQCWTAAAEAEWYAEFEDTSPVVKSKRGRNQVLPFKYRDSVVEPLTRWTSSRRAK